MAARPQLVTKRHPRAVARILRRDGFQFDRTPPPDWQARLDGLFPPSTQVSWLKVYWVSGERTDPVQRWVIFQMTPSERIPSAVKPFLDGPAPSKHHRIPLMREQWDLYHATGCYAQPFWIIQGERGGHKRRFSEVERKLCRAQYLPDLPPVAGALCYAPLDEQVIGKIAPLDQVRFYHRAMELDDRKPEHLEADERSAVLEMRSAYWQWLESQVDRAHESVATLQRPLDPTTDRDAVPLDYDRARDEFIHSEA